MKKLQLFLLLLFAFNLQAQESICPDVEGAIAHPLLTNYKNSCIVGYNEIKFDAVTFPASKITSKGALKEITAEGKVIDIIYGIDNTQNATVLEVQRNYEQALKNSGLEIIYSAFGKKTLMPYGDIRRAYEGIGSVDYLKSMKHQRLKYFRFAFSSHNKNLNNDVAYFLAQGNKAGKDYTIALYIRHNKTTKEGLANNIFVLAKIIESEAMDTGQVTIESIEDKITNEGKEVFHNILFDFGSDQLTSESYAVIETLAAYLTNNQDKSYYIVGHTDNIGSLSANQVLSEKRAKAVLYALTTKYGINNSQVSAHGVGQLSPLAINTTDEGRALNRRVEIVLK